MVDVYIFGERHSNEKHGREQARFILKKKPGYVLLEGLGEELKADLSLIREMVGQASEYVGATVGGCDPTMPYQLKGVKQISDKHKLKGLPPYTAIKIDGRYITEDKKEEKMGIAISAYAKSRTNDKPIVAIVGALHARKGSVLLKTLDSEGVSYKVMMQEKSKKYRSYLHSGN